ncbi:hypothetical protein, partial [Neobacillus vireti]|uniref:hypothetical protein n=1 Tax=Neobacillus vireti TaxID=220686 RepID=UPI002FFE0322
LGAGARQFLRIAEAPGYGSGWTRAERFKFKHLENKKRAQAAGPVQIGIYFKGGQFPLLYTIFISLLLQESYKKVTLLIYILLF